MLRRIHAYFADQYSFAYADWVLAYHTEEEARAWARVRVARFFVFLSFRLAYGRPL